MYEVHVTSTFSANVQDVFGILTDYEHFFRGPGMTCRLVREGREQHNGLGAVREVTANGTIFSEEITAFEPPRHFEYVVRTLNNARGKPIRLKHERGWLDLTPQGSTTRVDWHSRFAVPIPLLGWFVERILGARLASGFAKLLEQANADLQTRASRDSTLTGR